MISGFNSERGTRFAMEGKCSKVNGSFAATVSSYSPPLKRAKLAAHSTTKAVSCEKLALVIPALYEAANMQELLTDVRGSLEPSGIDWEVIVVDDDSCDGTAEIVAGHSLQDPRVRLLVRRGERGLAGAILHGWRHTDATILGAMDADGQHPAQLLPGLLFSLAEGRDLAIGSRYAKGSRCGWNPIRRAVSMAAILAARPLQSTALRVRDPLSGFFLVRRHSVENIPFQAAGFKLLLEILVRGRVRDVEEVPFEFGVREAGSSKLTVRVAWDYLLLLARLFRARFGSVRVAQHAHGD
jgi:dolichol-phosphate mannosyltransferase